MRPGLTILLLTFICMGLSHAKESDSLDFVPSRIQPWAWPFTINDYAKSAIWRFPQPACGQMKIVFVGEGTPRTKLLASATCKARPWSTPSHPWKKFVVAIQYVNYDNLKPDRFHFVLPDVTLRGFSANFEQPASNESLWLFNRSAVAKDIKVQFYPKPDAPDLDQEYKVLKLYSEREKLAWEIFVRFRAVTASDR